MRNIDGSISQNTDEGSGSKAENRKLQDVSKSEFSWLIDLFQWLRLQKGRPRYRPNNLSLVCLYLSLYISFLILFFLKHRQKALLYKSSRKHTFCMCWKFWDFSSFVKRTTRTVVQDYSDRMLRQLGPYWGYWSFTTIRVVRGPSCLAYH